MVTDSGLVPKRLDQQELADPQRIRVLRELERQGYLVEPHSDGSREVAICRHPVSPALLVRDDGRIEFLDVQHETQGSPIAQSPPKRIHWGRGLLFLTFLGAATFLGLLVVAMIVG